MEQEDSHKIKRPNFIVINKSKDMASTSANRTKHNNNVQELARGKQRASTSSCSSSDSYGSGYASGSGISTDHEQKEKLRRDRILANDENDYADAEDVEVEDEEEQEEEEYTVAGNDEHNSTVHHPNNDVSSLNDPSSRQSESRSATITPTTISTIASKNMVSNHSVSLNSKSSDSNTETPVASPIKSHQLQPNRSSAMNNESLSIDEIDDRRDSTVFKGTQQTGNSSTSTTSVIPVPPTPPSKHMNLNSHKPTNLITTPVSIVDQQSSSLDKQEPYYHTLFQWEQLVSKGVTRPLLINDLDFTDLRDEDDCDLLNASQHQNGPPSWNGRNQNTVEPLHIKIPGEQRDAQDQIDSGTSSGPNSGSPRANKTPMSAPPPMPPPPISPWFNTISSSRPQSQLLLSPTPSFDSTSQGGAGCLNEAFNREESPVDSTYSNYSRNSFCAPHTSTPTQDLGSSTMAHNRLQSNTLQPVSSLRSASSMSSLLFGSNGKYGSKRKKTMKLFWKEVREDRSLLSKLTKKKTIWDEIKPVPIDTQKLEYLFESKAKDLSLSRSRNGLDALNQRKAKITVLDTKRSNAINIGMTKLPPMRTIKSAILKMDSNIMNREGIEKILTTMLPTEEEKTRIIEAQLANPETPLGTAEQFLLNLASISALEARLKLWAFQLDYAQIEKEVAEPLMDLKQAIEEIEQSETFRLILGTLLSIGNFLNSSNAKGFQIDYLEKVPEVKDTVHKHSLLHHLCVFMQERYDHTSDLYSEFSAVNRASKIDYVEVGKNLKKMQQDCKASWDYLKIVAKHDGLANLMNTSNTANSSLSTNDSKLEFLVSAGRPSAGLSSLSNSISALKSPNQTKPCGKLNNLSKLSMITTITSSDNSVTKDQHSHQMVTPNTNNSSSGTTTNQTTLPSKQIKTKVSDFLTDCAERIMVLMVIHRRVMNRFQKLLVYLGCPSHQIKQTQPQQVLKVINEFALEYRTKRERVREMILKRQQCQHHHQYLQNSTSGANRWHLNRNRWAGSQQYLNSNNRPCSTASSYTNNHPGCPDLSCCDSFLRNHNGSLTINGQGARNCNSGQWADSPSNDYLYNVDQGSDYCQSRQQSVTPVPPDSKRAFMSASAFDLQNQQQSNGKIADNSIRSNGHDFEESERIQQRQKDEQLCRLLGVGKSFDGACSDLLKMSHWTTSQRVVRHPPANLPKRKQRATSIDCPSNDDQFNENTPLNQRRQSWQNNKYGDRNNYSMEEDLGQNSDEEIMQCLVRHANQSGRNSLGNLSGANINGGRSSNSVYGQPLRGKLIARDSNI